MQKFISVDPMEPGMVTEGSGLLENEREEQITGAKDATIHVEEEIRPTSSVKFEVATRDSSIETSSQSQSISSSYSKARESKAMKEPKSVRK
jgi:hypothetical protein